MTDNGKTAAETFYGKVDRAPAEGSDEAHEAHLRKMYPTMATGGVRRKPEAPPREKTLAETFYGEKPAADDPEEARLRKMYPTMFPQPAADTPPPAPKPAETPPPEGERPPAATVKAEAPAGDPGELTAGIELPEGLAFDEARVGAFREAAGELGLAPEGQRRLLEMHAEAMRAEADTHAAESARWADEARADPELSHYFDNHVSRAKAVLDEYADDELRELLTTTGLGNHRSVIRLFSKIGKDWRHLLSKV